LQLREDVPERASKADRMGFFVSESEGDQAQDEKLIAYARAMELGRVVGRDIGGSDPERMAPPRVAEYVEALFDKASGIKVTTNLDTSIVVALLPSSPGRNRQRQEEIRKRISIVCRCQSCLDW
jgi:leucyl aminopeptidase